MTKPLDPPVFPLEDQQKTPLTDNLRKIASTLSEVTGVRVHIEENHLHSESDMNEWGHGADEEPLWDLTILPPEGDPESHKYLFAIDGANFQTSFCLLGGFQAGFRAANA